MTCILKKPTNKSKGVVIFTTQERDHFVKNNNIRKKIESIKDQWVIGLHHNWHDFNFDYDNLFDFSMAGEEDLIEKNGKKVPLIPMDACNFVPEFFKPSQNEKFWDILYIARAVKFKKIPEFFQCVRNMYDNGKKYRILFVCPIPEYKWSDRKTTFYKIREVYDKMFSEQEKDLFTLLTTNYRNPFPFDLQTLSHFYKSSKVFVHFSDKERRCRVAAYAWASNLPVVGMSCIGSILPKEIRIPPYFYEVCDYDQFEKKIDEAINKLENNNENNVVLNFFNLENSINSLKKHLKEIFQKNNLVYEGEEIFDKNLDIRLGRHVDLGLGANKIRIKFGNFLDILVNKQLINDLSYKEADPEKKIEREQTKTKTFWQKIFKNEQD